MSATSPSVYLDLAVLIDYIRTHIEECDDTRKAVDILDKKGAYIEISNSVYDFWENSALDTQRLLKFLKKEVERFRHEEEYEDPEEVFASDVLERDYLNDQSEIAFEIKPSFETEIESHQRYLRENGLREYELYLKRHLDVCSKAHQKLDGIIDNRYGPGARDRSWVKMRFREFTNSDIHLSSLVDGYYWCKSDDELFVVRDVDRTEYDISDLKHQLLHNTNSSVSVVSPPRVVDEFIQ
jgi:hypothetical protein